MNTLLYRSGSQNASEYPVWLQRRVDFVDSLRPAGHVPRTGALFCSPDQHMFAQWHGLGRNVSSIAKSAWRIWVDAQQLHVYPTLPYEQGVRFFDRWMEGQGCPETTLAKAQEHIRQYWSQGIALSQWLEGARPSDDHDWELYEILVPESNVVRRQEISLSWKKKYHQASMAF